MTRKRSLILFLMVLTLSLGALSLAACGGDPTPIVLEVEVIKEVVVVATPTPEPPSGPPIKVGVLYGLSSIAAVYTQGAVKGHNLAVNEINAAGGVLGRPLELDVRETHLSPVVAAREVQSLVLEEEVDFLLGTISSGVAQAVSEFAKENEIIFIDSLAQSSSTTADLGHRYVFRSSSDTVISGRAVATVMAERPKTKYVTIGPDYAFGHDAVSDFIGKLQELKPEVEVVAELWPSLMNPDYTPFITAILEEKPDAVYASMWGGDQINFIKQAIPFGFFNETTLVTYNMDLDILKAVGADMPEGIVAGSGFPWWGLDTPAAQKFTNDYFNATGERPLIGALQGYTATLFLAAAIEKAGTIETEAVADALEGLTIDTPTGPITIRAFDHQADPMIWVGSSTLSEAFPFPILTDLVPVSGSDVILSIAEVEARRAGN